MRNHGNMGPYILFDQGGNNMTSFQKFMMAQSIKIVVSLTLVEVAGISLGIIMATEPWDRKTDSEKKVKFKES